MLRWAILFFVLAVLSGALGFWGIETMAAWIARVCFLAFLVVAVLSLLSPGVQGVVSSDPTMSPPGAVHACR